MRLDRLNLFASVLLLSACGSGTPDEAELEQRALSGVKKDVQTELDNLHAAAVALQAAAPAPDADGWNAQADPAAVAAMKTEWAKARVAYERVEGAIAVLFPNLDVSTDERYDGFLEAGGDDDLFDGEGVTGIHAIERILWADSIPPEVLAFEESLPGYRAAAFPATQAEAEAFKNELAARLVDDTQTMVDGFAPLALDPATAYRGVIGSMEEQVEKVSLASTGESESRYANHTLADMRANLEGATIIYARFSAWLDSKGGADLDMQIEAAFAEVQAEYASHSGDAIPPVPASWNPDDPSEADLATDYGKLWTLLSDTTDSTNPGSLVSLMSRGGDLLGIPSLPE